MKKMKIWLRIFQNKNQEFGGFTLYECSTKLPVIRDVQHDMNIVPRKILLITDILKREKNRDDYQVIGC